MPHADTEAMQKHVDEISLGLLSVIFAVFRVTIAENLLHGSGGQA